MKNVYKKCITLAVGVVETAIRRSVFTSGMVGSYL